jgi:ketosteroid isomerase-like protein
MSNPIETVKEIYAAFGRGDVPAILAHCSENVLWECEGPAELAFTGSRRGIKETTGFFQAIGENHSNPKLEMREFFSSGDAVAAFGRYECTLTKTGKHVNSPVAHYFRFGGGKIIHYMGFTNAGAFLDAAKSKAASR